MTAGPVRGPLFGYTLFFLTSALMASNVVMGRAAAEAVPPVGLAFWRWTVAFLLVLPATLPDLWRHRGALLAAWRRLLVLGALGMGVCGAFVYVGLEQTTATNAGLIYASSPALILLIAALAQDEPVRPRQIAGIAVAMAGVLAILARGDLDVLRDLSFNAGDVWILAAATAWAVYTIMLRRSPIGLPMVTLFAANALAGVLILAPFYAWETLSGRPVVPTFDAALSIVGVAVVASVMAFLAYQKTIAMIGPARAGTALYVMPLWAALLAWATLGESLQAFHLAGALLILPGVVMATLPAGRA